ncbi:MAG: hypothetical protein HY826_03080 [Actinobacteria bacterium]|nr:hypothetical protein [Actinomycetota bacterium]
MTEKAMDAAVDSAWEKRGFLAGVIFVALNVVGLVISGTPPALDASGEKIQEYFVDNDSGIKLAAILFAISLIFAVAWLGSLWRAISRLEPRGPRLALMAVVGFVISGAAAGVAQAMFGALTTRIDTLGGGSEFVFAVANALFGISLAGIAVHILALAALTMRSGFLPAWTGWLALLSAVACAIATGTAGSNAGWLLAINFVGFLSWMLWVLIASCLLYSRKAA